MGATTESADHGPGDTESAAVAPSARSAVEGLLCEEHGEIHPDERPWLPKLERGDLAPHPYCPECGEVEARGPSGLDRGGLVNLISRLEDLLEREGHVVTEAQKRIILKRLTEAGADDGYGLTRKRQLTIVAQVAGTILGITETALMSYLRSV